MDIFTNLKLPLYIRILGIALNARGQGFNQAWQTGDCVKRLAHNDQEESNDVKITMPEATLDD